MDMLVPLSYVALSDLWTYFTKPDRFRRFPELNQATNLNKKKDTLERKVHGSTQNFEHLAVKMRDHFGLKQDCVPNVVVKNISTAQLICI